MTKPQFSAEPSMEDILASIRKMISEERMGPRPIPDRIGRSPFGESMAEQPVADTGNAVPVDKRAERSPSFSRLSDALKAAAPAPAPAPTSELRRTLEEKIADMLDKGEAPALPASAPDPLAVFSARPAPSPNTSSLGGDDPRSPDRRTRDASSERAVPERASGPKPQQPESPFNGATRRRDESPAQPTNTAPAKTGGSGAVEPAKADSQRVIAMPARNGAAAGQHASPASAPSGLNGQGSNVASLGLRPFSGNAPGQRSGPSLRAVEAPDDKSPANSASPPSANPPNKDATAKSPDGAKGSRVTLTDAVAEVAATVERSLKAERTEKLREGDAKVPAVRVGLPPATVEPTSATERAPAGADKPNTPAKPRADGVSTKTEAKPLDETGKRAPSDALLDAVVAMVDKEPDSLSVFTSGNAFINGITSREPGSREPGSLEPESKKLGPSMPRRLDSSAAELLRPMLRQWLSDNMPRIVEEALRSELMNSDGPPDGSKNPPEGSKKK
jgi:cell pole-organizing protein PopZ